MIEGLVDKLQNNDVDLTERIPVTTKDEIGKMMKAINEFLGQLQKIIKSMKVAKQCEQDAESVNDIIQEFSKNTGDINDKIESMNQGINDISIAVDESAKGVTSVAESTSALVQSIAKIQIETENNHNISEKMNDYVG